MRLLLTNIFLFFSTFAIAHPFNANAYLVIDTDGGIDDFRALCLLLSAPDVRVLGITASSGVLNAEQAGIKAKALLNSLNREGVPVAINRLMPEKGMGCGPAAEFRWGDEELAASHDFISLDSLADYLAVHFRKKITHVSLGSLSSIIHLSKTNPGFSALVDRIIWSSDANYPFTGFNHSIDTTLADNLHHLPVKPVVVNGPGQYTGDFISTLGDLWSRTADMYALAFGEKPMQSTMATNAYDEMVAVYLHFPEFFTIDTNDHAIFARYASGESAQKQFAYILEEYHLQFHQVMETLPREKNYYQADVQQMMGHTIQRHGVAEWNSVVQTFELHRHIGIYALVGAKMGIRALEYFGAGIDELSVLSHTGYSPPVSCMMDGIQVSTGATVGHGLIRVMKDRVEPTADFTYLGTTIRIRLKESYRNMIADEIGQLVRTYGLESDDYWVEVRANALRYWLEMCRYEIFEIEKI